MNSWKNVNLEEPFKVFGNWEWYKDDTRDILTYTPTETEINIYPNAGEVYKWMVFQEWSADEIELSQAINSVYSHDTSRISSTTPYKQIFNDIGDIKLSEEDRKNLGIMVDRYMAENGLEELERPEYLKEEYLKRHQ